MPETRRSFLGSGLIIAAALLTRLPTLFEPLAMDQSLFAVIADGLLRGDRLYVDLWDHKPPGIYLLYAAIIRLLGGGAWGFALASIAAQTATALLVRALVARASSPRAGLIAGLLYALVANPILLGGFYATAQAEVFIETLVAGAIVLAARAAPRPSNAEHRAGRALERGALVAGLALGAAATLKPTALLFIPVIAIAPSAVREPRVRWVSFFGGLVVAPLAALLFLVVTGVLPDAAQALAGWNLASLRAAGASSVLDGFSWSPLFLASLLLDGILHLGPFLLFAVAGVVASRSRFLWIAWLAAAAASCLVQGKLYRYHYQPLLAPLMTCAAIGVDALAARLREARGLRDRALLATAALAALSLIPFGRAVTSYWFEHADALRISEALPPRGARFESYVWASTGMRYGDAARVAALVSEGSDPSDCVYVLGFDPQIYRLAERAPAGRYLAHDHVRYPGAERRLVEDLDRRAPRWVIVATDQVGPRDFPLVSEWIAAHLASRGTLGRFALFERAP